MRLYAHHCFSSFERVFSFPLTPSPSTLASIFSFVALVLNSVAFTLLTVLPPPSAPAPAPAPAPLHRQLSPFPASSPAALDKRHYRPSRIVLAGLRRARHFWHRKGKEKKRAKGGDQDELEPLSLVYFSSPAVFLPLRALSLALPNNSLIVSP